MGLRFKYRLWRKFFQNLELVRYPRRENIPRSIHRLKLEQDNEHLDSVIRTILTWDKTDNQIIVASIQGKETASKISDVNIITLENPQNHLFNLRNMLCLNLKYPKFSHNSKKQKCVMSYIPHCVRI